MPERRLKWVGTLAVPFLLAACAEKPNNHPIEPPRYEDNIASQPTPQDPPLQNPEPVINQLNGNTIITEDGKTYELRPQVSMKQLLQTASLLSVRAPQAAMVKTHIYSAKQKWEINSRDPQISEDINKAAYLLFSYREICQDTQTSVGGVARDLTQDMASYLYEHDEPFWDNHKSPYINGPCTWGEPDPNASTSREPTIAAPESENTRNTILIRRGDYEYKLYTDVTLDEIIDTANSLTQTNAKPQIIKKLQTLRNVLGKDPNNTVYLFLLEQVLSMNNNNCEGGKSIELTKQVASWVKQKYPEKYEVSSALFEQGPCSVIEETRAPATTRTENVVPIIDLDGHLTFRTDKYSYKLYPTSEMSPTNFKLYNGPALALAFPNSRDVMFKVIPIVQEIDRLRENNINDPAQIPLLYEILNLITPNVCANNFVPGAYVKAIASIEYHLNPKNWPQKVDNYLNHPCFWGEKY